MANPDTNPSTTNIRDQNIVSLFKSSPFSVKHCIRKKYNFKLK